MLSTCSTWDYFNNHNNKWLRSSTLKSPHIDILNFNKISKRFERIQILKSWSRNQDSVEIEECRNCAHYIRYIRMFNLSWVEIPLLGMKKTLVHSSVQCNQRKQTWISLKYFGVNFDDVVVKTGFFRPGSARASSFYRIYSARPGAKKRRVESYYCNGNIKEKRQKLH